MFKKFLTPLFFVLLFVGGLICTPSYAVKCDQHGRTSVFRHTNADDISMTVNAMWDVYNEFNKLHGKTINPEDAADMMFSILDSRGLGSFVARNGTTLSHAVACAIFHSRPGLVQMDIAKDTNSIMHWFEPIRCDDLAVATYVAVENFKKAGYVEGTNNYVALLFTSDIIIGQKNESPLFHLCGFPKMAISGGRMRAFCDEVLYSLGELAWQS